MKKINLTLSFLITLFVSVLGQTVTDIDGNVYNTVVIGTQEWMAENLRTTRYSNGDPIPYITNNSEWENTPDGAYSFYNNDVSLGEIFGPVYNGFTILDNRNVCPVGWHVPSDNEWIMMFRNLCETADCEEIWPYDNTVSGPQGTNEGGKIKATGTSLWTAPNIGATNSSGLSILPGGYRYWDGNCYTIYDYTNLWTTTEHEISINLWFYAPHYNRSDVYHLYGDKHNGQSVRCIRAANAQIPSEKTGSWEISPNPAEQFIQIRTENIDELSNISFEIINSSGFVYMNKKQLESENWVDVSTFPPGMYFIRVNEHNRTYYFRFIKL